MSPNVDTEEFTSVHENGDVAWCPPYTLFDDECDGDFCDRVQQDSSSKEFTDLSHVNDRLHSEKEEVNGDCIILKCQSNGRNSLADSFAKIDALIETLNGELERSGVNSNNCSTSIINNVHNYNINDFNSISPSPSLSSTTLQTSTMVVPQGMKHLVRRLEQRVPRQSDRRALTTLLLSSRPTRSKWSDPRRVGQAELYDALERVLVDLKAFTPYSLPFCNRVSRKEVPDYYDVISDPMDFGTMWKKLKALVYSSKAEFTRDLELIYSNCFHYNTDPDSLLRRHVMVLKERWCRLMSNVPDIQIQSRLPLLWESTSKEEGEDPDNGNEDQEEDEDDDDYERLPITIQDQGREHDEEIICLSPDLRLHLNDASQSPATPKNQSQEFSKTSSWIPRSSEIMARFAAADMRKRNLPHLLPERDFFHNSLPDSRKWKQSVQPNRIVELRTTECLREMMLLLRSIPKTIEEGRQIDHWDHGDCPDDHCKHSSGLPIVTAELCEPAVPVWTERAISRLLIHCGFEGSHSSAVKVLSDLLASKIQRICQFFRDPLATQSYKQTLGKCELRLPMTTMQACRYIITKSASNRPRNADQISLLAAYANGFVRARRDRIQRAIVAVQSFYELQQRARIPERLSSQVANTNESRGSFEDNLSDIDDGGSLDLDILGIKPEIGNRQTFEEEEQDEPDDDQEYLAVGSSGYGDDSSTIDTESLQTPICHPSDRSLLKRQEISEESSLSHGSVVEADRNPINGLSSEANARKKVKVLATHH